MKHTKKTTALLCRVAVLCTVAMQSIAAIRRIAGFTALAAVITIGFALPLAGCDDGASAGSGRNPVQSVVLSPPILTLAAGSVAYVHATVWPVDSTNRKVSWVSSAPGVATVDASGYVTAVAAGTATITVRTADGGKTAECTVTVKDVNSIEITAWPDKTVYGLGDTLDITGLEVTATYSDGTTGIAVVTAANISGFDSETEGQKTLTVTLGGKTATFTVTVKEVASIAVTAPPSKTAYYVGDTLELAGLVVTASYGDGSSAAVIITAENISGFDSETEGEKTVTVTYGGKTATFTVTVTLPKTLESISAVFAGSFTVYEKTPLDNLKNGLAVTAAYRNGETAALGASDYELSGKLEEGESVITVSYTEGGVTKTTTFEVTVSPPPPYGISLSPVTFPAAAYGYGAQAAQTVSISNVGTNATGVLAIAIDDDDSFTLSKTSQSSVPANDEGDFTVTPNIGLDAGVYTARITVSNSNISESIDISFTVNKATPVADDFDIGEKTFAWDGAAKSVSVTAKDGKPLSVGAVLYAGSETAPQRPGTYAVTFTVTADNPDNYTEPTLPAGNLVINAPTAAGYTVSGNETFAWDNTAKSVSVTANNTNEQSSITVKYGESATAPQRPATYAVTFDVKAADGSYTAATLSAGNLVISAPVIGDYTVTGTGTFAWDGAAKSVSVSTTKPGTVNVLYAGSATAPQRPATYAVTFDVTGNDGSDYTAATLTAGNLVITAPTASGYTVTGERSHNWDDNAKTLSVTANNTSEQSSITVLYNGSASAPSDPNNYTVTFDVKATDGSYTAAAGLSAGNLTITLTPFTTVAQATAWLARNYPNNSAANPVQVPMNLNLGGTSSASSNWGLLLTAIDTAGKFVSVNLSACTMSGTTFDNGGSYTDGKKSKIVSVTLPSAVTTIGNDAFNGSNSLTSVTIPAGVTSIYQRAFSGCESLVSVTFEGANVTTFLSYSFPGDLSTKYQAPGGGIGTYTRPSGSDTWTKQ